MPKVPLTAQSPIPLRYHNGRRFCTYSTVGNCPQSGQRARRYPGRQKLRLASCFVNCLGHRMSRVTLERHFLRSTDFTKQKSVDFFRIFYRLWALKWSFRKCRRCAVCGKSGRICEECIGAPTELYGPKIGDLL